MNYFYFLQLVIVFFIITFCNGFIFDAKTDCLISSWGAWTEVPGLDLHIRERAILRHGYKGGIPCPPEDKMREAKTDAIMTPFDSPGHVLETAKSLSENFIRRHPKSADPTTPGFFRDLVIVIDSLESLDDQTFNNTKQNLAELLGMFCPDPDPFLPMYNHAVLIDVSNSRVETFGFNNDDGIEAIKASIRQVPRASNGSCTEDGLDAASSVLTSIGIRSDNLVDKDVLIVTDGYSNCSNDVVASALKLRGLARVFSLLISPFATTGFKNVLNYVTTPVSNNLFVIKTEQGFDQLMAVLESQMNVTCLPLNLPTTRLPNMIHH